ncbi:uncharacterized protein DNG_07457 [Cephalotrichum gorgonifer]|uniref:Uncharacterized protein n=1 Tax=Cephalotrichum gorgonifer TaxID=2041049 RepID=A0AAE8SY83_9PEZI|nr:uncharacterized protein DNG_07457 [Cephalotrichum gorgonifer]
MGTARENLKAAQVSALNAGSLQPTVIIIGTTNCITNLDLGENDEVQVKPSSTAKYVVVPPFSNGRNQVQDERIVERLFNELRIPKGTTSDPTRALYLHDYSNTDDDTQHQQLPFASALIGKGCDTVARLVLGRVRKTEKAEKIARRWRKKFKSPRPPVDRVIEDKDDGDKGANFGEFVECWLKDGGLNGKRIQFERDMQDNNDVKLTDLWKAIEKRNRHG